MFEFDNITELLSTLKNGGLILFPTDTIWGIGCDATNEVAVEKVFQLKQRTEDNGFVLLADSIEMVKEYVAQVHPRIDTLLQHHIRPLTVVYDKANNLPTNVLAENGSVAFRVPVDNFCRQLVHLFGKPIVATTANINNEPYPITFGGISSAIIQGVDYVVRYRREDRKTNEPSVIIRLNELEELDFIRE
ncbi:MAG: hypothetical protein RLZZ292_75 [Bacteroidota bacterium]|jgi:L-threonylcarbamoyladenylate synthase